MAFPLSFRAARTFVLLCALANPAWAQPPSATDIQGFGAPSDRPDIMLNQLSGRPPQDTLQWLRVSLADANVRNPAVTISGANPQSPDLAPYRELYLRSPARGAYRFEFGEPPAAKPPWVATDARSVTWDVTAVYYENGAVRSRQKQTVTLRREATADSFIWRIVPPSFDEALNAALNGPELGLFASDAFFLAHPKKATAITEIRNSAARLQEFAAALADYKEKTATFPASMEALKASGFKDREALFDIWLSAPNDEPGARSYNFNSHLSGLDIQALNQPENLITLYHGADGKLSFRSAGRALVVLADGQMRAVTPEQAKMLHWKP